MGRWDEDQGGRPEASPRPVAVPGLHYSLSLTSPPPSPLHGSVHQARGGEGAEVGRDKDHRIEIGDIVDSAVETEEMKEECESLAQREKKLLTPGSSRRWRGPNVKVSKAMEGMEGGTEERRETEKCYWPSSVTSVEVHHPPTKLSFPPSLPFTLLSLQILEWTIEELRVSSSSSSSSFSSSSSTAARLWGLPRAAATKATAALGSRRRRSSSISSSKRGSRHWHQEHERKGVELLDVEGGRVPPPQVRGKQRMKGREALLTGIAGKTQSGEFTAVMGPSGERRERGREGRKEEGGGGRCKTAS